MFAPFYFLGYYCSKNQSFFSRLFKSKKCLIFYPISMLFYTYKDSTKIIVPLENAFEKIIPSDYLSMFIKFFDVVVVTFYNHFIVAPLGIIFAWGGVHVITTKNARLFLYIRSVFSYIGNFTMEIYLLSGLTNVYIFSSTVNMIVSFFTGLIIPIAIAKILIKINVPYLRLILFGSK